ncbi:hypothetical protein LX73_0398 [Fodinibius salinus]|uniref:Outer membrane protein transport protein (OMPP1/FadL/TodX) n=1 Tax=Fodinibius salinus TaxID=860790 RepID=A0A5D3YQ46_9BACT|nr:hypothetical protein LX73_0398 [Fodinibius salinus]
MLGISCCSFAQSNGLELLTIGPGTKALALNETVTASLLGGSDIYANPANLALEPSSNLNADYSSWIAGLSIAHAAVNFKKGPRALAFGFLGAQTDNIALRGNQAGPANGTFSISFLSLSGAYAHQVGPITLGATLQYLWEEYYIYSASGYSASFGAATKLWNDRIHLGTSFLNLGQMNELRSEASTLPTRFKAGINIEVITFTAPQNNFPITMQLLNDWVIPTNQIQNTTQSTTRATPYTTMAVQLEVAETITLQSGYNAGDTVRRWSAGAEFTIGSVRANYSLSPFETGFGTAHSLGINYQF